MNKFYQIYFIHDPNYIDYKSKVNYKSCVTGSIKENINSVC